jgi:hypothetical protein
LQLKGKRPLGVLALCVLALVIVAAVVTNIRNKHTSTSTASAAASNALGGTTATPAQVKALESWGLQSGDFPAGTLLRAGGELQDYADAQNNPVMAKQLADSGRVDGFFQYWVQNTAQYQFQVFFDMYATPSEAMGILGRPIQVPGSQALQALPDPKLGDKSRMYSAQSSAQAGPQRDTWVVQWVRGRTVLYLDGSGPTGSLHEDNVLNAAKLIDSRAKQAPIK